MLAMNRGNDGIDACDVERAFVNKQAAELARLFSEKEPLDVGQLRDYVNNAEPDDDEDDSPIARYSIAEIEENVKKRICGQEVAVERVIPWVKRLRFGLPRDGRPAAVFLFLGPTGTGKTQLAKELARYVFGDEEMMIFIEMGQFKTKESMSGFIGAPPGYIGYGEGLLTNGLRDKPECVVLFDEIEKAARSRCLTSCCGSPTKASSPTPRGRCATAGSASSCSRPTRGRIWLRDRVAADPSVWDDRENLPKMLFEAAREELKKCGFRPEFLGRVDEIISFLPFTLDTCRKIVDFALNQEQAKFLELKGVTLDVGDECRDILAKYAHDREHGPRGPGSPAGRQRVHRNAGHRPPHARRRRARTAKTHRLHRRDRQDHPGGGVT